LEYKIDIKPIHCHRESACNTTRLSQQSNVKWKVPATEKVITPTKCQMDRTLNTKHIPQQPNVIWKVPGTQNNITAA